jgi:hypothetical protein
MGQIGRQLKTRYEEHRLAFKNNDNKSAFAQPLITDKHTMGSIEEITKMVYKIHNCTRFCTIENYVDGFNVYISYTKKQQGIYLK